MLTELILIGLGLAMDAFAVTISNLCSFRKSNMKMFLCLPVAFGLFQAIMPVIGYYAGSLFAGFLEKYAGIVTLLILGFIGIKAIIEAFKDEDKICRMLTIPLILIQGVATSIDALLVGVSFCAKSVNIWYASGVIGITTFIVVLLAIPLGRKFGNVLGTKAQIFGGVILCAIGIKSFLGK